MKNTKNIVRFKMNTKLIESYLDGELDADKQLQFEKLLETDQELRKEFELRRDVNRAILIGLEFEKQKHTCKTCKHRQRWKFNSKVFQYCGVIKSNLTQNKLLKIKCNKPACRLYEKE